MEFSESPRHFFNFLTCREVDFNNLEGCIYNFACGLQRYVLNREPKQFETTRFLVDGSHWTSKKKFREDSRSGGHLGCSSGYNFNIYKGAGADSKMLQDTHPPPTKHPPTTACPPTTARLFSVFS